VAVGLVYDAKARFRSRAFVRVGQPAAVAHWAEDARRDERATVRAVTEDLAEQLSRVNPSFASWTQATRLSWIAEVVVRAPGGPGSADMGSDDVALADKVEVAARLAAKQEASPSAVEGLFRVFAAYERDLNLLGVNDAQLATGFPRWRRLAVLRSALMVLVALPFAAVGALVHLIPFQIMKQVGKRPTNEGIKATVKLLGCFVLFALTYVLLGVLVGRALGAWAGVAAAVAAPWCGYVAVRFGERVKRIGGVVDGYRMLKGRRSVVATALQHRAAVVAEARSLLREP
jgi:hypothetical protein